MKCLVPCLLVLCCTPTLAQPIDGATQPIDGNLAQPIGAKTVHCYQAKPQASSNDITMKGDSDPPPDGTAGEFLPKLSNGPKSPVSAGGNGACVNCVALPARRTEPASAKPAAAMSWSVNGNVAPPIC